MRGALAGDRVPEAHGEMQRFGSNGIQLDTCATCRGTWFDMGEIAAVYSLQPVESLASFRARQPQGDLIDPLLGDDGDGLWDEAAGLGFGILRRFL